jgi:hypothetical protein
MRIFLFAHSGTYGIEIPLLLCYSSYVVNGSFSSIIYCWVKIRDDELFVYVMLICVFESEYFLPQVSCSGDTLQPS